MKRFYRDYVLVCLMTVLASAGLALAVSGGVTVAARVFAPESEVPVTVILDPGHGGEDGGALSCTGLREAELNLQISLRLRDLLSLCGLQTRMIREDDRAIYSPGAETLSEKKVSDLKNRVALVNGVPNALLLSIHQNQFPEQQYHGAQVFYAGTAGSRELAEQVRQSLKQGLDPANRRECKPGQTIYLLNKISCPGILVECGFLSNPAEERKLRSPEYQKQLACAVGAGLLSYLSEGDTAT